MKLDLKFPNFGAYQCHALKLDKLRIIKEWDLIDATLVSPFQLKILIDEFLKSKLLNSKNITKFINSLSEVENILKDDHKSTSLEFFLESLNKKIEKIKIESNIVITLELIYSKILLNYKREKISNQLKSLGKHYLKLLEKSTIKSKDISILTEFIDSQKNIVDFLESKFKQSFFNTKGNYSDIDFKIDYSLTEGSNISVEVLKRFIELRVPETLGKDKRDINIKIKNLKERLMSEGHYTHLDEINLYKLLLNQLSDWDFDSYPDIWMRDIHLKLGNITTLQSDLVLKNWTPFTDEQRKKFKTWVVKGKLEDFFKKRVNQPERYIFWKNYLNSMKEASFFEDIKQAIVIELNNHTVIEYGEIGHAAYVYPKNELSIKKVQQIHQKEGAVSGKLKTLREISNPIQLQEGKTFGWNHSTNWEIKFQDKLSNLGYQMIKLSSNTGGRYVK